MLRMNQSGMVHPDRFQSLLSDYPAPQLMAWKEYPRHLYFRSTLNTVELMHTRHHTKNTSTQWREMVMELPVSA